MLTPDATRVVGLPAALARTAGVVAAAEAAFSEALPTGARTYALGSTEKIRPACDYAERALREHVH
jgi:hypothetical protein